MATRGAYGFRVDGVDKVTYNHHDSYPEWLGERVVAWVRVTPREEIEKIARGIVLVSPDSVPTAAQVEECREWVDLSVSEQTFYDWYCLLRRAQGDLSAYQRGLRYMTDDHEFLADSLFCEWAYIINLDEGVLEVYRGFQKRWDPNPRNRYRSLPARGRYYPVALVAEFPLDGIPADWVDRVKQAVAALRSGH
ncbi:MAG: hypothetical protein AB1816_00040 [Bacillota bacterium]